MKKPKQKPKKKTEQAEEPETTVCAGAEPATIEHVPIVRCTECSNQEWRKGLCYHHWKLSQGFEFDEEKKSYVKAQTKRR